jgi:hypothetical protein
MTLREGCEALAAELEEASEETGLAPIISAKIRSLLASHDDSAALREAFVAGTEWNSERTLAECHCQQHAEAEALRRYPGPAPAQKREEASDGKE